VVDLDDLMSRRMKILLDIGEPLAPGYLMQKLPPFITRQLFGTLGKLVSYYESRTLPWVEAEICDLADAIVLLSGADMEDLPPKGRAARYTILPTVTRKETTLWPQSGALRFAFIGTDALTQNRLSIDYLVELWQRHKIEQPLVIVGIQNRKIESSTKIQWLGYVDSIDEVYDGRTILLTPSFIPGGIKTKVLEAFSYGAPVIGSSLTFEAMPIQGYPLQIDDEGELVALLRDPEQQRNRLDMAAAYSRDYLFRHHDSAVFTRQWLKVMGL